MRRPTTVQLRRRRTLVALVAVAAVALTAAGFWARGRDDAPEPATESEGPTSTAAAARAEPEATTTTTAPYVSTGRMVPDTSAPGPQVGQGPLRTYRIEVEDGTYAQVDEVAATVEEILSDVRGWTTADGISLQRVSTPDAEIVITLATPGTVDLMCYPLLTDGDVSCAKEGRAILNVVRWNEGAPPSGLGLEDYRRYLVSHEVGHVLGHRHVPCPGPGVPAPVMVQQTLGIGECAPNPWPVPDAVPPAGG